MDKYLLLFGDLAARLSPKQRHEPGTNVVIPGLSPLTGYNIV
jgi:hypothetical protein